MVVLEEEEESLEKMGVMGNKGGIDQQLLEAEM